MVRHIWVGRNYRWVVLSARSRQTATKKRGAVAEFTPGAPGASKRVSGNYRPYKLAENPAPGDLGPAEREARTTFGTRERLVRMTFT